MRICIFFHRFDGGGAEKVTIRLANELKKRGHDITVAVRYNYGISKELLNDKIKIYDMELPEKGKIKKNFKNIKKLCSLLNDGTFDIMMAVMSEMAEVAAIAYFFSKKKTPLVCVLHNTISTEKRSFQSIRRRLRDFFDDQYSLVVAVSEAVREDYLKCCNTKKSKVFTIYNPVVDEQIGELAECNPDHPWLYAGHEWKTLLLIGRLSYQKNHILMFQALKLLRQKGDFRLILLGEGEEEMYLKNAVKTLGIEKWVDFLGYSKNPFAFMANCDALVLSSHYEGLPTVLIEALACGCHIVSVDCPSGPREILEDGKYGTLVQTNNAEALKNGIIYELHRKVDREFLKERALQFSVDKSVLEYEKRLRDVLKETWRK